MTGFAPISSDDHSHTQKFVGKAIIIGPKWTHMPTLTIGLLGVSIFWSVEMGYASPYLLSLGLSKSSMAIVFLAGPLSGLLIQPIIGVLADNTTSRFGRRRPWMMAGVCICILAMLLFGYTRGFAAIFTGWNTPSNDWLTMVLAVLSIYLMDFSLNAVMAMDRALLVDTLPPDMQASGHAWAARMQAFGAVIGFFVGSIPLPSIFPILGTTEIQVLSFIVSLLLLLGHIITAICVKERVLLRDDDRRYSTKRPNAFIREVRTIWTNFVTLPPVIRQICIIQFCAWIAWFPLIFYTTLYIGDLYKRTTPLSPNPDIQELQTRDAEATRLGTRALLFSAIICLFIILVLPACVAATSAPRSHHRDRSLKTGLWRRMSVPERLKVDLASMWAISNLVLAMCMFGTLFVDSVEGGTFLMGVTGFSGAIAQWVPFSLLGEAIRTTPDPSHRVSILLSDARTPTHSGDNENVEAQTFLAHYEHDEFGEPEHEHPNLEDSEDEGDLEINDSLKNRQDVASATILGNRTARTSTLHVGLDYADAEWGHQDLAGAGRERRDDEEGETSGLSAKAGIILGIHNVSIVIPQFLVTGLSAVIFAIFDPVLPAPTSTEGRRRINLQDANGRSNSVVYMFRLGGIAALVAFILCWRLAKMLRHR